MKTGDRPLSFPFPPMLPEIAASGVRVGDLAKTSKAVIEAAHASPVIITYLGHSFKKIIGIIHIISIAVGGFCEISVLRRAGIFGICLI